MYIGTHAATTPDKPAVIMAGSRESLTYKELDDRSNRLAQLLHKAGLRRGDRIVIFMENHIRYMEVVWAAFRSGLYVATVNRQAKADDVLHIVTDSEARAIFTSIARSDVAAVMRADLPTSTLRFVVDGSLDGWADYETEIARFPATRLEKEWMGQQLDYTSGTTGRPKGVMRALPDLDASELWPDYAFTGEAYGFHRDMVSICPAPLYHSAPMRAVRPAHIAGGTVIVMEKFDPLEALKLIDEFGVTHGQWVPTMFVRMLRLPDNDRLRFDISSLQCAVHAAAPCPVDAKRRMLEWWGPIIHEYYGATDGVGATVIGPDEWLAHEGSVGRAPSTLHICDEQGNELPTGQSGQIYFQALRLPLPYYINDPDKTRSTRHPIHDDWVWTGDIGYVDEQGYLFLTDRKAFMIISGGVNIYPQAIEDALLQHPEVVDVAVFGVPHPDLGEEVRAVIELAAGIRPSDSLRSELADFAAQRIARYMVPRSFEFMDRLPRSETGKLLKKEMRDRAWAGRSLID